MVLLTEFCMMKMMTNQESNAQPIFILIRPQMGENIGAVARAMSNFGLSELRIVAPRDGWPNKKASEMAAGGLSIIENAKIYDDFASSMADIHVAYATTARPRDMVKRLLPPEIAMQEATKLANSAKIAFVFGPERTGLENGEITLCDNIISIATAHENPSLNLAQCSVIIGYEWLKASSEFSASVIASDCKERGNLENYKSWIASACLVSDEPATKQHFFEMFKQLEDYLDKCEYFRTEHKKTIMWQNLRNMFLHGGAWNEQEIRTFRGMIRALWERNP